ncbi:hypothetical protein ACE6H2_003663 [Prunus campanulata]
MTRQPLNLLDHLHQTILQFLNPFTASLSQARQAHAQILKTGLSSDTNLTTKLLSLYANNLCFDDANFVLDSISEPNLFSYSTLIHAFAKLNQFGHALALFSQMLSRGLVPDSFLFPSVVKACAGLPASKAGKQSKLYADTVAVLQKMHSEGFRPDGSSISSALPAVGHLEDLGLGIQIHGYVVKQGLGSDKCVVSALIDMYGKRACSFEMSQVFHEMDQMDVGACNALVTGLSRNGLVDDALEVFRQFKDQGMELNIVSWTSIIASCSQNGKDMEALELFREMQVEGVEPNSVTIPCLLPACGNIAALMHGKAAHLHMLLAGDKAHPQMNQIIEKLNELSLEMKKSGYFPNTHFVLQDVEEQDKEQILCGHSEKLAVVLGLLNTPPGSSLRVLLPFSLAVLKETKLITNFGLKIYSKDERGGKSSSLAHCGTRTAYKNRKLWMSLILRYLM